jgi:hypothetical protein
MITNLEQRFTNKRQTFKPPTDRFNPVGFDVSEISKTAAKNFVEKHHYSGSFPASRFFRIRRMI